jgi:hypothetical protein
MFAAATGGVDWYFNGLLGFAWENIVVCVERLRNCDLIRKAFA